jgi:hypothetical protein
MDAMSLRELQERLGPVTLSTEQLLTVPAPLLPLFPFGGLQKGSSVGFDGPGSMSVALAMAASVLDDNRWMAIIGFEEIGLLAASELGVRLDRLLLVAATSQAELVPTVAALVEAVDIIALCPRRRVGQRDARRLTARARERGTVLFHLDGGESWPEAMHLHLTAEPEGWEGLGTGHGHLQHRRLSVAATGRRSAAQRRQVSVLLPGPTSRIEPVEQIEPISDGELTPIGTPVPASEISPIDGLYAKAG